MSKKWAGSCPVGSGASVTVQMFLAMSVWCVLAAAAEAASPDVSVSDGEKDSDDDEFGGEFCLSESFNASCRHSSQQQQQQLIVMTSAEYGRMRSGRCVEMKYGQPGCRLDVLAHLDAHCSGRSTCSFAVARLLQAGISPPCDDELKSYLYASYRCVTGIL